MNKRWNLLRVMGLTTVLGLIALLIAIGTSKTKNRAADFGKWRASQSVTLKARAFAITDEPPVKKAEAPKPMGRYTEADIDKPKPIPPPPGFVREWDEKGNPIPPTPPPGFHLDAPQRSSQTPPTSTPGFTPAPEHKFPIPSADDLRKDADFQKASREYQIAYLNDVDSGFASASTKDQLAYLDHVVPPPPPQGYAEYVERELAQYEVKTADQGPSIWQITLPLVGMELGVFLGVWVLSLCIFLITVYLTVRVIKRAWTK